MTSIASKRFEHEIRFLKEKGANVERINTTTIRIKFKVYVFDLSITSRFPFERPIIDVVKLMKDHPDKSLIVFAEHESSWTAAKKICDLLTCLP